MSARQLFTPVSPKARQGHHFDKLASICLLFGKYALGLPFKQQLPFACGCAAKTQLKPPCCGSPGPSGKRWRSPSAGSRGSSPQLCARLWRPPGSPATLQLPATSSPPWPPPTSTSATCRVSQSTARNSAHVEQECAQEEHRWHHHQHCPSSDQAVRTSCENIWQP